MRQYCDALCVEHRHIRFVEMPTLREASDIELDRLYVEPRLSQREVQADTRPNTWPATLLTVSALQKQQHLVILGDPGSGKSTLVSYITWQLARPVALSGDHWSGSFGGLVPLPMILRELDLRADLTWETLLRAFGQHRIGRLLPSLDFLAQLLKSGRALVLLDGLDEIGNLTIRRKLRDAVHSGMANYPSTRWILTSRIVGYEQVPFHVREEVNVAGPATVGEVVGKAGRGKRVRVTVADLLYMVPFADDQIEQFSRNWYSYHEGSQDVAEDRVKDFLDAIRENQGTQQLARLPYLLTLMALIHHRNAQLPYGRTELYERIAQAYLESIDLRRQLDRLPYSLAQKKQWLAEIAYQMQLRRSKRGREQGATILAAKRNVRAWLRRAMKDVAARDAKREAEVVLEYFAKRSGLLLPRGEGQFAFMHLSMQEYFAACFLAPQLTASRFLPREEQSGPTVEQLKAWVNEVPWRETFVFLFELLGNRPPAEVDGLLGYLFMDRLRINSKESQRFAAELLAELVTDPFVRLTAQTRREMRQLCWKWVLSRAWDVVALRHGNPPAPRCLLREHDWDLNKAWQAASISKIFLRKVRNLALPECPGLHDLTPLATLKSLRSLSLRGGTAITDLRPLTKLKVLEMLTLGDCANVKDFAPLSRLSSLRMLVLENPIDLSIIEGLGRLQELHLHYSLRHPARPVDITPLAGLAKLVRLCINPAAATVSADLRLDHSKILSRGVLDVILGRPHLRPIRPPQKGRPGGASR